MTMDGQEPPRDWSVSHSRGLARLMPIMGGDHDDREYLDIFTERTLTDTVTERIHVGRGGVLVLKGTALAGIVVTSGGWAEIAGTTRGILVAVGGHAVLTGRCCGPAVNDGGYLTVHGIVDGPLIKCAGRTAVEPKASG